MLPSTVLFVRETSVPPPDWARPVALSVTQVSESRSVPVPEAEAPVPLSACDLSHENPPRGRHVACVVAFDYVRERCNVLIRRAIPESFRLAHVGSPWTDSGRRPIVSVGKLLIGRRQRGEASGTLSECGQGNLWPNRSLDRWRQRGSYRTYGLASDDRRIERQTRRRPLEEGRLISWGARECPRHRCPITSPASSLVLSLRSGPVTARFPGIAEP